MTAEAQPGRPARGVVEIYTDGACSGNPGPGGWGALLIYGGRTKELCGGEATPTTNNRMELMAAIMALESLTRRSTVRLHTDSSYVRNGVIELAGELEAQRVEDREQAAGQERGPVAAPGRRGRPARRALALGQGTCGQSRQRARGCAGQPGHGRGRCASAREDVPLEAADRPAEMAAPSGAENGRT